jgi:hypothetical protein
MSRARRRLARKVQTELQQIHCFILAALFMTTLYVTTFVWIYAALLNAWAVPL